MIGTDTVRTQLLTAAVPFIQAAAQLRGVTRIALLGSLTTKKAIPKDLDLLLSVEDEVDLEPLAKLGRKLQGRISSSTHANYGADLFVANARQRYLGRLCGHRECPGMRICAAEHCGRRPYLRDDLRSVTLERALVVAPPLIVWPIITDHVIIPADVEQYLVQPLIEQLDLERMKQIIPRSVHTALIRRDGTLNLAVLTALQEAAVFLSVSLTEEIACSFIEISPAERYASLLQFPLPVTRLWVVEIAGKACFVAQKKQAGKIAWYAK